MIRFWAGPVLPFIPLLLFSPFFLFPTLFPHFLPLILGVLLALYTLAGMSRAGKAVLPFGSLLLPLALLVPIAFWVSAQRAVSIPKLYLLFFGLVTCWFFSRVRDTQGQGDLAPLCAWFFSVGVLLLGLLGPFVTVFRMPHKFLDFRSLQGTLVQTGEILDVNILGCLLAVGCVFAVVATRYSREQSSSRVLTRVGLALCILLALLTLLTQARAAIVGLLIALIMVAGIMWRKSRIPLLAGVALVGVLLFVIGPWKALSAVSTTDRLTSMEYRLELWNRASYAIQDVPFTGVGPGMFDRVVPQLYPFFLIPASRTPFHAHNMYLQIALDVGIPGLVAFMALLGFSLVLVTRAIRSGNTIAVGYLGAMIVVLTNGLLDSPLWLNKPHPLPFFLMGMMIALGSGVASEKDDSEKRGPGRALSSLWRDSDYNAWSQWTKATLIFILWVLVSLGSISLVNSAFSAAIALAILGGAYVGWEAARLAS